KELVAARVPATRVRRALGKLRDGLPTGRTLTALRITADGTRLVVRDGEIAWNPDSGQVLLQFAPAQSPPSVAEAISEDRADAVASSAPAWKQERDADAWYARGCSLEATEPERAREAYRRALELEPKHADAHVNLGRLLHESGDL